MSPRRALTENHSEILNGDGHPLWWRSWVADFPDEGFDRFPDGGGYPRGFLSFAYKALGCTDPHAVLHVCSGSVRVGVTVDVCAQVRPRVVGDARRLPFLAESFQWALADPPYAPLYAENLYGTRGTYPKPAEVLRELERVLRPGGRCGLLHFLVPTPPAGLKILGVTGVTVGCNYYIRAFTVLEKPAEQQGLSAAVFGHE